MMLWAMATQLHVWVHDPVGVEVGAIGIAAILPSSEGGSDLHKAIEGRFRSIFLLGNAQRLVLHRISHGLPGGAAVADGDLHGQRVTA